MKDEDDEEEELTAGDRESKVADGEERICIGTLPRRHREREREREEDEEEEEEDSK